MLGRVAQCGCQCILSLNKLVCLFVCFFFFNIVKEYILKCNDMMQECKGDGKILNLYPNLTVLFLYCSCIVHLGLVLFMYCSQVWAGLGVDPLWEKRWFHPFMIAGYRNFSRISISHRNLCTSIHVYKNTPIIIHPNHWNKTCFAKEFLT